jgi:hypothetical protein
MDRPIADLVALPARRFRLCASTRRNRARAIVGTEMRHLFTAAILLWSTTAFAADPVGTYTIEGTNPGNGSKYSGKVTVEKTGETFRVVWDVGGSRYIGTGLGDKNFIAVSYSSGSDTGLALYGEDGGNWKGVWTYAGSRNMGTETWKRQ